MEYPMLKKLQKTEFEVDEEKRTVKCILSFDDKLGLCVWGVRQFDNELKPSDLTATFAVAMFEFEAMYCTRNSGTYLKKGE